MDIHWVSMMTPPILGIQNQLWGKLGRPQTCSCGRRSREQSVGTSGECGPWVVRDTRCRLPALVGIQSSAQGRLGAAPSKPGSATAPPPQHPALPLPRFSELERLEWRGQTGGGAWMTSLDIPFELAFKCGCPIIYIQQDVVWRENSTSKTTKQTTLWFKKPWI